MLTQDEILERAERFFAKGNYRLAKQEFEHHWGALNDPTVLERLAECGRQLADEDAQEFVRRARKALKKDKPDEALRCFEAAQKLRPEPWIEERIAALKSGKTSFDAASAASEAEAKGDFAQAAELHRKALAASPGFEALVRTAFCLVQAGRPDEARSLPPPPADLSQSPPKLLYDWGYVQAKLGDYSACLRAWNMVKSSNPAFLAQKRAAAGLWAKRLSSGVTSLIDTKELLSLSGSPYARALDFRCRVIVAEQQAKAGEFADAIGLLPTLEYLPTLEHIILQGKLHYHALKAGQECDCFDAQELMFTAAAQAAGSKEEVDKLLLKYHDELEPSIQDDLPRRWHAMHCFLVTSAAVRMLPPDGWRAYALTPYPARLLRRSDHLHQLFAAANPSALDAEACRTVMESAAAYGPFGTQVRQSFAGGLDLASLPPLRSDDQHVRFAAALLRLHLGVEALHNADYNRAGRALLGADLLLLSYPLYADTLAASVVDYLEVEAIQTVEDALRKMNKSRRDPAVDEIVAKLTVRRVLRLYHSSDANLKALSQQLRDVMDDLPDGYLEEDIDDLLANAEEVEIVGCIERHKLNQAAQVAAASDYESTYDFFFDECQHLFDCFVAEGQAQDMALDLDFGLRKLLSACLLVDSGHSLTAEIRHKLNYL